MRTALVLTMIGEDRPGLVEQVSQLIAARQGQWLESKFSRLEGKFAGILQASVPSAERPALETELQALLEKGLSVMVEEGKPAQELPCYPMNLRFVGQDRNGIVAEISAVLNRHGVSILNLSSRCEPAPMSGENLFYADFEVRVPVTVSSNRLTQALEALTPELIVDLESLETNAI